MQKPIILSLLAFALANCQNHKESSISMEEINSMATEQPATVLNTGCYCYDDGTNVISFDITGFGNQIMGALTYALEGKDLTIGTFEGYLSEQKLFGIYMFSSEGVESTREVAFILKDDQLIEGYGELNELGNSFRNKDNISYSSTMPLTKTDCGNSELYSVNGY
ncbi:MAG TPA: hypothetical protein VN040_05805 [Pseudosphingobacterium sp.]|nr:hypothetical protein [Pseudosphingobacterium sp.]